MTGHRFERPRAPRRSAIILGVCGLLLAACDPPPQPEPEPRPVEHPGRAPWRYDYPELLPSAPSIPAECARVEEIVVPGARDLLGGERAVAFPVTDPRVVFATRAALRVAGAPGACEASGGLVLLSPTGGRYAVPAERCGQLAQGLPITLHRGELAAGLWSLRAQAPDSAPPAGEASLTIGASLATIAAPSGTTCFYPRALRHVRGSEPADLPEIVVYGRTAGAVRVKVDAVGATGPLRVSVQDPAGKTHELTVKVGEPATIPASAPLGAPSGIWRITRVEPAVAGLSWMIAVDAEPQVRVLSAGDVDGRRGVPVAVPGADVARASLRVNIDYGLSKAEVSAGQLQKTLDVSPFSPTLIPEDLLAFARERGLPLVVSPGRAPAVGVLFSRPWMASGLLEPGESACALPEHLIFEVAPADVERSRRLALAARLSRARPGRHLDETTSLRRLEAASQAYAPFFAKPDASTAAAAIDRILAAAPKGADALIDALGGFALAEVGHEDALLGKGGFTLDAFQGTLASALSGVDLPGAAVDRFELGFAARELAPAIFEAHQQSRPGQRASWSTSAVAETSYGVNPVADSAWAAEAIPFEGTQNRQPQSSGGKETTTVVAEDFDESDSAGAETVGSLVEAVTTQDGVTTSSSNYMIQWTDENGTVHEHQYTETQVERPDGSGKLEYESTTKEGGEVVSSSSGTVETGADGGTRSTRCASAGDEEVCSASPSATAGTPNPDDPCAGEQGCKTVSVAQQQAFMAAALQHRDDPRINCGADTCDEGGSRYPGLFGGMPVVFQPGSKDPWINCDATGLSCEAPRGVSAEELERLARWRQKLWTDPRPDVVGVGGHGGGSINVGGGIPGGLHIPDPTRPRTVPPEPVPAPPPPRPE